MSLSSRSLKRPVTVLVTLAAILVLGGVSLSRLKLDFLPKVDFPFVGVQIPYPNAVPSQVEREISRPVEEVMATLGGVKELNSYSDRDGAFVGVMFDFDRDIDVLRLEVKEKMEQVRPLLPEGVEDYFIFTFNTTDIPVMEGRISAPGLDLASSYDLLERRIIAPLQRIDGVGRVMVDGISPKDVTIYLRLDKIIEHNIDVGSLFRILNASNMDLSVGRVMDGHQRVSVRSLGQFRSLDEIRGLRIGEAGLRLDDIADIIYAEPAPQYYRHLDGEPAIAFVIQKASGANIVEVTREIRAVMEQIDRDPALAGIQVVVWFDQGENIMDSLRGLLMAGLMGSAMAIGILFVFLRRLRTTLVAAIAIPVSVIATCTFLYLTGRSLNILTMMGLMLAVGMLVDNAIVVLEAIFRRQEQGEEPVIAAEKGSREVSMAVVASTLTSIIVFAPIVLTKNSEMALWLSEVGLTISITLVFSLLLCLTLVPLLASRIRNEDARKETRLLETLRERYLHLLRWTALRHRRATVGLLILGILLTSIVMKVSGFGPSEMGESGDVKLDYVGFYLEHTDNANLYRVRDYVDIIEPFLIAKKDSLQMKAVYAFFTDNYTGFRLYARDDVSLGPDRIKEIRSFLRENLPEIAGAKYRFRDDDDVGDGAKLISVTLFGEDTDLLEDLAGEVIRRMALIDDLHDVGSNRESGRDEIRVILDRQLSGRYGVSPADLAQVLGLTFRGVPLRRFQGENREIDLGIVLEPADRRNIDNLKRLPVTYRDDRPVLLGQVARFEIGSGPDRIQRERQQTALGISGSYEGEDYDTALKEVSEILDSMALPAGYSWSYGRHLRRNQEQQDNMAVNTMLALICVYLVMAALFESFLHPLVIMLCIPFAALGAIWTLILTATPFSLFAMIGMVILIGIVVNNGIVLLDHVNALRRAGLSRDEAILRGCRDRFRPILMTAATTILGLAPLALGRTAVAVAIPKSARGNCTSRSAKYR